MAACASPSRRLAARDLEHCEEALEAIDAAERCNADLDLLPECTYLAYLLAGDLPSSPSRGAPGPFN